MIRSDTLCRNVRHRLKITQVHLAGMLGVHPVTVSKWERYLAVPSAWQIAALEALSNAPAEVTWSADEILILDVPQLIVERGAFTAFATLLSQR